MSIDPKVFDALRMPAPLNALRGYVRSLQEAGHSDEEILVRLVQLRAVLRDRGRGDEEDVVLEVMDFVAGWCSPQMSLRRADV